MSCWLRKRLLEVVICRGRAAVRRLGVNPRFCFAAHVVSAPLFIAPASRIHEKVADGLLGQIKLLGQYIL